MLIFFSFEWVTEELEEIDSNVKVEARDSDERVDDEVIEEEQDDYCPDLLQKFQRYIQRERRMCAYKEEPKVNSINSICWFLNFY